MLRKILCKLGFHFYDIEFIPYDDQPFLTGKIEDDSCTTEGKYVYRCKYCGKKSKKKIF